MICVHNNYGIILLVLLDIEFIIIENKILNLILILETSKNVFNEYM